MELYNEYESNSEKVREESLKKAGYLTVNKLIDKLQELKNRGYGEKLVGSDFEHYQYCDYEDGYVIIC